MKRLLLILSKGCLLAFIAIFICLLTFAAAMRNDSIRNALLEKLSKVMAQKTGWEFRIEMIEEIAPFHWQLRKVMMRESHGIVISVDSIQARLSPRQLLVGKLTFTPLVVQGIQVPGLDPFNVSGSLSLEPFPSSQELAWELDIDDAPKPLRVLFGDHLRTSGSLTQDGSSLSLHDFEIVSPFLQASGEATLQGDTILNSHFTTTLYTLGQLQAWLPFPTSGQVSATGKIKGLITSPELTVHLSQSNLFIAGYDLENSSAQLHGRIQSGQYFCEAHLTCPYGQLTGHSQFTNDVSYLSIEGQALELSQDIHAQQMMLGIELDHFRIHKISLRGQELVYGDFSMRDFNAETWNTHENEWPFQLTSLGEWNGPWSLITAGTSHLNEEGTQTVCQQLKCTLHQQAIQFDSPLAVRFKEGLWRFEPFRAHWGQAVLEGHGTYKPEQILAAFRLQNLPLEQVAPLLADEALPIHGWISGEASVIGNPNNPEAHLQLACEKLALSDRSLSIIPPLQGHLTTDLHNGIATLNGWIEGLGKQPVRIQASVPVALQLSPTPMARIETSQAFAAHLDAAGEISPILETFFPGTTHLTGNANLTLNVTGTLEQPSIRGMVDFQQCTFESLSTGCVLKNMQAHLSAKEDELMVTEFRAQDGETGLITGSGSVRLDPTEGIVYAFDFNLRDVVLLRRDFIKGTGSGLVHFNGQGIQSSLSGEISTKAVDITLPQEMSSATTSDLDVIFINQPLGASKKIRLSTENPTQLNVKIHIPDRLVIRSNDLDSKWGGDLLLSGTTEAPELHGDIKLSQGDFRVNGKPFALSNGKISFAGDIQKETTLSVTASQDIDGGVIEAIFRGSLRSPTLSLRANPPMAQREILSWLLFGRGLSDVNPFESSQLNQLGLSLSSAGKSSKPGVLSRLQNFGIDRIQVDSYDDGEQNHVSVNVGKYLTRNLYISVNKGITDESGHVRLEADVIRNVKLQAQVADDAAGKMLLMWRRDY